MRAICNSCEYVFTSLGSVGIKYKDSEEFGKIHYVKALHKYEKESPYLPLFSDDISMAVYGGGVAAYPMIQLAAYTGVSEIYLLGMDNLYANAIVNGKRLKRDIKNYNHILEEEDRRYYSYLGKKPDICVDEDMVGKSYLAAEKYCKANNIKIYNATRGGALEIFERVDLDTVI